MRLIPSFIFLCCACGSSGGASGDMPSGPETLRSTGTFIRACVTGGSWAKDFSAKKKGAKPKVQLAPLTDKVGGTDTQSMLGAIERAFLEGQQADVLPWGDALLGMASYQGDAMALGRTEESVNADPDFIIGGTIERIANGGTFTQLALMDNEGNLVCKPQASP
jgi:hypothetical protein